LRVKRWSCALLAACLLVGTVALPAAAAVKLPAKLADTKASIYAKHTCTHDVHCIRSGVTNCKRQSPHSLLCRMFVERSTPAQGRYTCRKLVRVALDPATVKILIAGSSGWTCR
jgi:hypothetical protein